jgi:hypothetical protein
MRSTPETPAPDPEKPDEGTDDTEGGGEDEGTEDA